MEDNTAVARQMGLRASPKTPNPYNPERDEGDAWIEGLWDKMYVLWAADNDMLDKPIPVH